MIKASDSEIFVRRATWKDDGAYEVLRKEKPIGVIWFRAPIEDNLFDKGTWEGVVRTHQGIHGCSYVEVERTIREVVNLYEKYAKG